MASSYMGVNSGDEFNPDKVQVSATTTTSTDIELRIDLTKSPNRQKVINALETIISAIADGRANVALPFI